MSNELLEIAGGIGVVILSATLLFLVWDLAKALRTRYRERQTGGPVAPAPPAPPPPVVDPPDPVTLAADAAKQLTYAHRTSMPIDRALPQVLALRGMTMRLLAPRVSASAATLEHDLADASAGSDEHAATIARICHVLELPADYFPEARRATARETLSAAL